MNHPEELPPHTTDSELPPVADPPPRRLPNLAHALLFLAITAILLLVFQLLLVPQHAINRTVNGEMLITSPKRLLTAEGLAYLAALLVSWLLFPRLWGQSFLSGIQWRWEEARRQAIRLVPLGFVVGVLVALVSAHFAPVKDIPVDAMFASASDAWLITLFGTLVAPVFEEICFRGFLLPAFAVSYDWLALPRTPEAHLQWRTSTTLSAAALAFSAILSSIFFALLHGEQIKFQVPVLAVLFSVSLVLTLVRLRTRSVACSAIVHAAYNSLVFLGAIVQSGGYRHLDKLKS